MTKVKPVAEEFKHGKSGVRGPIMRMKRALVQIWDFETIELSYIHCHDQIESDQSYVYVKVIIMMD